MPDGKERVAHASTQDASSVSPIIPGRHPSAPRPVAVLGDPRRPPLAVVAVGLAVAAAHRLIVLGADFRHPHAGPLDVGALAEAGAVVAPEPAVARDTHEPAASLPLADREGGEGNEDGEGNGENRDELMDSAHERSPAVCVQWSLGEETSAIVCPLRSL